MAKTSIRNRPIATVLREYSEKRKGKVVSSRDELHRRFDGLDWNIQKKIIMLHLQRAKTDRLWAYTMLLDYWDDSFVTTIEELWDKYHEPRCSWLVTRYLSDGFIKANIDSLCQEDEKNYFFIAARLGLDKDFNIDRSKLSASDYLSILRITKRSCTSEDALSLIKEIAVDACKNDEAVRFAAHNLGNRMNKVYARKVPELSKAFYNISKMRLEPAIERFMAWSDKVSEDVEKSEEWKELQKKVLNDFDYNTKAYNILLKYILIDLDILDGPESDLVKAYKKRRLDHKEKEELLNKMFWKNPNIFALVDQLDLEITD